MSSFLLPAILAAATAALVVSWRRRRSASFDFVQDVRDYFAQRPGYSLDLQRGCVQGPGEAIFGLSNLEQAWNQCPPHRRRRQVAAHFDNVLRIEGRNAQDASRLESLEFADKYLSLRVYPVDMAEEIGADKLVHRIDFEDTVTVLCADMPDSVRTISPSTLAKWGISMDEAFARGLDHVRKKYRPTIEKVEIAGGQKVTLVSGEDFFVPTHLLDEDWVASHAGSRGALVALPHRHSVMIYPIEDIHAMKVLPLLVQVSARFHGEGPGSIAPWVYLWRKDASPEIIRHQLDGDSLQLFPGPRFQELFVD